MGRFFKDRRHAQAGTTLIELLVSLTIIGLALVLVIGTFSTGLLDATLVKRNTAVDAVQQYEMDKISASPFNPSAPPYSECFATENTNAPQPLASYQGSCPDSTFALRADVAWSQGSSASIQVWTVAVAAWPSQGQVGSSISVVKVNR
ncbi:type II secretion system protein [bacterium]|nr:MAG: type II secretion system protein [bacterium]